MVLLRFLPLAEKRLLIHQSRADLGYQELGTEMRGPDEGKPGLISEDSPTGERGQKRCF